MRTPIGGGRWGRAAAAGAAALLALAGAARADNMAPYYWESFENYDNGYDITNVTGWSSAVSNAGVVSTDPVPVGALSAYTNAVRAFPLPGAPHAKVLQMSETLTNSIGSVTGGVVIVDLLVMPTVRDAAPDGNTNSQFSCYVDTNNQLAVWHYDASVPTNTWLSLTNSPTNEIGTGVWCRLTVHQDYGNRMFQVAVNGSAPIQDAKGWTAGGGSQPGTWFRMVGTNNAYLSRFRHQGEQTTYLDDLVVTNRSLRISGMGFVESAANDGSIATTNTLTLWGDTFVNTTYSNGTHFTVTGVPAGLGAALSYLNPTQVTVTLTNRASPHTAAASTNAMTLTLLSPAFTLGRSADVGGSALTGMSVTFADPPYLSYSNAPFVEGVTNGSIDNTVTITLTGDTFTNVSPLVAGTHYTNSGVPAGLTLVLTTNSATQLTATLTGQATSSGQSDSTNFNLTFLDNAFTHVGAANILGSSTNLGVQFLGSPQLAYSTNIFAEVPANNGAVLGGTIDIQGDMFNGTQNEDFVVSGKVQTNHVPAGLTVALTLVANDQLAVAFTGHATSHANENDVTDLTFTFQTGAFVNTLNASTVSNYNREDLVIDFQDQPVLSYSGTSFAESGANDGTISNTLSIALAGTTFTGANGVAFDGSKVTVSHVPAGLSALVTKVDATNVTVQLTGTADPHRSSSDTSSLSVHFSDAAFNTVLATNITGAARDDLSVTFIDTAAVAYSTNRFAEASANDGTVPGSATITLTGDTFTGTAGEVFGASKVTFTNVPAGLTGVVTRTSATLATLTFAGVAAPHAAANSVTNVGLTFASAAFSGGNASGVGGYQRGDLAIDFQDQPVLNYSGTGFTESGANDGTISTSLSITLTGTTFTGANGVFDGSKVTASNVPAGLSAVVTKVDASNVTVQLTGTATPHRSSSDTSSLSLHFSDAAFNTVLATNIIGAARDDLSVIFIDTAAVAYSTNRFAEASANDGTVAGSAAITLTGDTFAGTDDEVFGAGKVTFTNVPAGLTGVVTRTSATLATLTFAGVAASHVAADSVANVGLTFASAAFSGGNAAGVGGYQRGDLAIDFRDAPVLTHAPGAYAEATINDGSIGNTVVFSLTGDTFTNVAVLAEDVHYTKSGVPAGLALELDVTSPTQVLARLTGNASPHDSGAGSTIALAFLDAAFANVSTSRVAGVSATLPVTFNDAPVLTYSGDTFRESLNGAIDNGHPITITLSSTTGEAFAGTDGDDFVALNRIVASGLPNYLTAVVTRVSATVLDVTLTGAAVNNTSADSVTGMTLTFQNAAFTVTQADQVQNYAKSDLKIQFLDAVAYVNLVPYRESFESYTNGVAMGAELGWDPGNAGVVTTETAVVSALTNAFTRFPIATNHAQVLRMTAEVTDEIQSAAGGLVYADLMVYVTPREDEALGSTNFQFAMYVNSNQNLVIWHRDTSGDPTNTWLTLSGGPTVTTGAWHRVSVVQDQANFRYQVYLDGSPYPVNDAAGYDKPTGTARPGSWFNMVNRNGYLSRVRVSGVAEIAPAYLDDLVVDTRKPDFFLPPGSVFRFR